MLVRKLNFYAPIGLSGWLKHNVKDYDVIHVHEFFAYQSYVACKIARRLNRPYMIQPHGSLSRFCQTSRFNLIKKIVVRMFAPLVKSCSAIIALNEAEKEDIAKVYPKTKSKIKIAPNGLDLDEFTNISPIDLHRAYSIVAKNKIIAFEAIISQ